MISKWLVAIVAAAALGVAGYSAITAARLEAELDTMRAEMSRIDAPRKPILPSEPSLSPERLRELLLQEENKWLGRGCVPPPGQPNGPQLC